MKKSGFILVVALAILAVSMPLRAQGGCENSPENPTIVLALVGAAGAVYSHARNRMKIRSISGKNNGKPMV